MRYLQEENSHISSGFYILKTASSLGKGPYVILQSAKDHGLCYKMKLLLRIVFSAVPGIYSRLTLAVSFLLSWYDEAHHINDNYCIIRYFYLYNYR